MITRRRRVAAGVVALVASLAGLAGCASVVEAPPADLPSAAGPSEPAAPTATASSAPAEPGWWQPAAGLTWQWQLTGTLDLDVAADVYDVDLFTTSAAEIDLLHAAGRRVVCYLSAGSFENFRPDAGDFPPEVLGDELDGWPDERWLDIRARDVLLPIMAARLDQCAEKGFDGVEPDNVDGFANDTGFDLTAADQEAFNREIARLAHERGLAVGLKNDLDQVAALEPDFDFAVNEQCAQYNECSALTPFIDAGKPVFHVEYELDPAQFCPLTRELGFSSMLKTLDLDASRTPC